MPITMRDKVEWCLERHRNTNHFYDKYLPYEFHLRMVVQAAKDWKHLLPANLFTDSEEIHRGIWEDQDRTFEVIELACWGHDLIEDARVSYNDCKQNLNVGRYLHSEVAEIIRAVTNYGRGRNRKERMPDEVYEDIRTVPGALYVKLCDRIANVQYSKMTKSSMFKKYEEENKEFFEKLGYHASHELRPMFEYLLNLFNEGNIS